MADGKVVIDVDMDTDDAEKDFDTFQDRLRSSSGSFRAIGALLGSSLATPILAVGVGAVGALGASFVAAGAGVAAFAAVAIPTLKRVFEETEGLTKKEQEAQKALQGFKTFWADFTKSFQNPILDIFIKSLGTLKTALTQLRPVFEASIKAVAGIMNQLDQSIKNGELKPFFDWLGQSAGPALTAFVTMAGNLLKGLANIFIAFGPLSTDMQNGLVGLTQRFAEWSAELSKSKGFQQFIDYVRANGPTIMSVIGGLWNLLMNLLKALAPIGAALLPLVDGFLNLANGFLELHPAIGPVLFALTGIGLIAAKLIPAIMGLVGLFKSISVALAGVSAPVWIWIAAIGALIAVLVIAWQKSEQFRNVILAAWEAIKVGFQAVIAYLTPAVQAVVDFVMQQWQRILDWWHTHGVMIMQAVQNVWNFISSFISGAMQVIWGIIQFIWPAIEALIKMVWENIKGVISGAIGVILSIIQIFSALFTGNWSALWDGVKSLVSNAVKLIWNLIQLWFIGRIFGVIRAFGTKAFSLLRNTWSKISSGVSSFLSRIASWFTTRFNAIRNTVATALFSIKSSIRKGILAAIAVITSFSSQFLNAGKSLLKSLADGIKSGIKKAVSAVKSGMKTIRSYLPFSPAKEGPLADLDKSGESFFPTFASKMNRGLTPAIHQIDAGLSKLNTRLNQERLRTPTESMSGATTTNTVNVYPQRANLNPAQLMRELQRASRLNGRTLL